MDMFTENLLLRTVTYDDISEVARMWNFEKGEISLDRAKEAIDWMKENHEKNERGKIIHICFAVFEKNSNKIIGWCGLDGRHENILNIFYLIDKRYRRGYATECANIILEYGFTRMEVNRIDGKCKSKNRGSKKVLEKIGMNKIGLDKDGSLHYFITLDSYKN